MLPGLFGRNPWKSADITAFGYIVNIAQGKTSWLAPTVGALLPADGALLPYWIGAVFVRALGPLVEPTLAARIPFALLLALALALTWYAAYHLARSESAQPLPFAFGGEAAPVDYARAIADGALLALIASLGLLQLGHETTPELVQLAAVAMYLYGLAAARHGVVKGVPVAALAIVALAASGAPSIAMLLAAVGISVAAIARDKAWRDAAWLGLGAIVGAAAATALDAWANRLGSYQGAAQAISLVRQIAWFAWPAWLLALWTLWQWRRRLASEHIIVPLGVAATLLAVWVAMAGSDRALMLALPPLAGSRELRVADAQAQRRGGDRLVLGVLLHDRRGDGMGLLRRHADRHTGPKLAANVAGSRRAIRTSSRRLPSCWRWPERSPGSGWCAGARGAIAIRSGRAWSFRLAGSASAGFSS